MGCSFENCIKRVSILYCAYHTFLTFCFLSFFYFFFDWRITLASSYSTTSRVSELTADSTKRNPSQLAVLLRRLLRRRCRLRYILVHTWATWVRIRKGGRKLFGNWMLVGGSIWVRARARALVCVGLHKTNVFNHLPFFSFPFKFVIWLWKEDKREEEEGMATCCRPSLNWTDWRRLWISRRRRH